VSTEEIERNYQLFGCHHIACGRVLKQAHQAAAPWLEHKMRGVAPGIEPVRHIIEGARAYNSMRGLPDPHEGGFGHITQTADRVHHLAREYDKLPLHDPDAESHFSAMRDEVHHQYDHLTNRMGVKVHVVDHDPYRSASEMAHDLRTNKQIKVLGTAHTGGHPFFSDAENDRFRAVHDAFGHAGSGRDFDGHGEEAAFHAHSRMFGAHAAGALASETRGQNGSVIMHDAFGPQKIALMPKHLWTPGGDSDRRAATMTYVGETARARDGVPNSILEPGRDYPVVGRDHSNLGHSKFVILDTGKGRGNYIWAPEEHVHVSSLAEDYRLHRYDQERRAEQATHGYGEETRAFYGDPSVAQGDRSEKSLTYKDYLHHMRQPREEEEPLPDREWHAGHEMGVRHAEDPEHADFSEMHQSHADSLHPDQFFAGYRHGWGSTVPQRVARHLGYAGGPRPTKPGLTVRLGHVSGNSIDVLHCPFCGSGSVIARSDGTIECNFCTSVFTVQVQPQYAAFPQTVQGQPYQWPGMPGQDSVVPPGPAGMAMPGDPGQDGAPGMEGGDDDGEGEGPPWMEDGGNGDDGGDAADGGDSGGDEDEDEGGDEGPPSASVKGRSQPPWLKKSFRTTAGVEVPAEEYMRHLAIAHAKDPADMAARVKAAR
jgi:hypothetical protein